MAEDGTPTLFVQGNTEGEFVEYTPPEPPGFHDSLPEDIRESEHLSKVEDNSQLARYYVDLKSNWLKPPDAPEGYEYEKTEDFDLGENSLSTLRQYAFDNGFNQKQFSAQIAFEQQRKTEFETAINKQIETNQTESENALKAEWGEKYEEKVESAKTFLNHDKLADNGFKTFLEESRFGDNPSVIKFVAKLSELISEDAFGKPGKGGGDPGPQTDEAGRPMLHYDSMKGK